MTEFKAPQPAPGRGALPPGRMTINGHSVTRGYCVLKVWTIEELAPDVRAFDAIDRPPRFIQNHERAKRFCARWNGIFGKAAT